MKSFHQYISQVKTLHSLNEFIEEKLVINKDFKCATDWKDQKYLFDITLAAGGPQAIFTDINIVGNITESEQKNCLYVVSSNVYASGNPSGQCTISDSGLYMYRHFTVQSDLREFYKIKLHQDMCEQFFSFINNRFHFCTLKELEDFFEIDFSTHAPNKFKNMYFNISNEQKRINTLKSFINKNF